MEATIDLQRPLQMPENYDFSQRHVNWQEYRQDFLLRTDAVWEKSKLYAYFYSLYKAVYSLFKSSREHIIKKTSTMISRLNMRLSV